jgi:hypothetical protein
MTMSVSRRGTSTRSSACLVLALLGVFVPSHAAAQLFPNRVVAYHIGTGGGAGSDKMPDIVLGPPHGGGPFQGSTDTLSLGLGGWIELEFTDGVIVDGPGVDFTVFENAFLLQGLVTYPPFAEPATVSVSADGVEWRSFPCQLNAPPYYPGCAGVYPVFANAADSGAPSPFVACSVPIQALVGVKFDAFVPPDCSGGDSFDLADVDLPSARFVRIDASGLQPGLGGTSGFDLDAVAAIHTAARPPSSSTTTVPTAAPTTTTTPTEPCPASGFVGVRCLLRTALATPMCTGDRIPSGIRRRLDRVTALAASATTLRNAKDEVHLARMLESRLAKIARFVDHAGRRRRLSAGCRTALESALAEATNELPGPSASIRGSAKDVAH